MALMNIPAFGFDQSSQRAGQRPDAPMDPASRRKRIRAFSQYMGLHPGAAPGGTGDTGLSPIDAKGWSNLLGDQQQYIKDVAAENGQQANVRFGGYSGGFLGDADHAPGGGGRMPSSNAGAGLRAALAGGNSQIGSGMSAIVDKLSTGRSGEGAIYALRQAGLLPSQDELDAQAFKARRSMQVPEVGSQAETDLIAGDAALKRQLGQQDTFEDARAKSAAYWRFGQPMAEDQQRRAIDLATTKGDAAAQDDIIRANAAKYAADQRLAGDEAKARGGRMSAALSALRQELNSLRQYGGDQSRINILSQQLDKEIQGMSGGGPGAGPQAGGAPQQFSPEIEKKLKIAVEERGWTRDDAIAEFQRIGVIPR